ncbi:polyadenylate-binding protein 1-like isoform X2 [Salvia divinorum]|uniref:Polyadenylate-binding protein 1-like isoform X2 n=1 Tax=Salvia divinorum TaxID=28513 RepID=A0ABD1FPX1_SALDI
MCQYFTSSHYNDTFPSTIASMNGHMREGYAKMLNAPKLLFPMKLALMMGRNSVPTRHLEVPKAKKLSSPMELGSNGKGKEPSSNRTLAVRP